ncbi:MAG TPA: His/Gly/Thr/Pro-type tRNA ligase C-terminal domain-containing protein, partial [Dehalococcoidia bacterium]
WTFYGELGLTGLTLKLNSIGDANCRPAFVDALREYYRPLLSQVCADDRMRFEKNPLRMLDCKEERCQPLIAGAPRMRDYLCDACKEHFETLQRYLSALRIKFVIDDRLVRGLDYYTRTAFEVEPSNEASQSSIAGGGRYDGLAEILGGPPTPGIGFGTGVERIILNLKRQEVDVPLDAAPALFIAHLTPGAAVAALTLADAVRAEGLGVLIGSTGRSLKAQMRLADSKHARFVAIIGADDLAAGVVTLRNLATHDEQRVKIADVPSVIAHTTR